MNDLFLIRMGLCGKTTLPYDQSKAKPPNLLI